MNLGQKVTLQYNVGDHSYGDTGVVVGMFIPPPTYTIKWDSGGKPDQGWQAHWFTEKGQNT